MDYVLICFAIGFVIFFHELGHFIAAKAVGVPVAVFSIGFGPRIWGRIIGGTEYRVSWLPIGGYVLPAIDELDDFLRFPLWSRMVMSAAGPLASLVLPFLCFMVISVWGGGGGWQDLIVQPTLKVLYFLREMLGVLPHIFSNGEELSGVAGIVVIGGDYIQGDLLRLLDFSALLSINLAVINMLPIPALDGGKLALYVLEWINPKLAKLQLPLALGGWVLVLGLVAYTTVLDVLRFTSV